MRNPGDDEAKRRESHSHAIGSRAILGLAIVLGIATLSAYYISGKESPVQPANGAAQAMALASSKSSAR